MDRSIEQGEEGEPDSVDKPGALMERQTDPDVDEDGNLVLHTFWVCAICTLWYTHLFFLSCSPPAPPPSHA